MIRSLLFVPGDSEKKLAKAEQVAADVLILDLEDSVTLEQAKVARQRVAAFLQAHPSPRPTKALWVRINPVQTQASLDDLAAIVRGEPDAILLPKCRNGADLTLLDHHLSALEVRDGLSRRRIGIAPILTETPGSILEAHTFINCSDRFVGLSWGPMDLAASLQATTNRTDDGEYDSPYQLARSICLLTARAAGVEPLDTIHFNSRDAKGLETACISARRAGFSGKLAIHPDQVPVINATFRPSDHEVRTAQNVLQAFEGRAEGTVGLNGEMLDMPHLVQARMILARAGMASSNPGRT